MEIARKSHRPDLCSFVLLCVDSFFAINFLPLGYLISGILIPFPSSVASEFGSRRMPSARTFGWGPVAVPDYGLDLVPPESQHQQQPRPQQTSPDLPSSSRRMASNASDAHSTRSASDNVQSDRWTHDLSGKLALKRIGGGGGNFALVSTFFRVLLSLKHWPPHPAFTVLCSVWNFDE